MPAPAFSLPSPQTGTTYPIHVHAPDPSVGAVPAVLFMDGDDQFPAAVEAYRAGRTAGDFPPLLLAGVGYGASYTRPGNRRVRDYTPTRLATEPESGGADAFLAFLADTLWPELTRRYAIAPGHAGIAGHSLGSLVAVHALFRPRPFFDRVLASAPSLWWDERAVLGSVAARQRAGSPLRARLHLSAGAEDTESMATDLALLERQLAATPLPELVVISARFAGRDHYNVLPDAFRAGLRALYA
ncbi:alpha/beta hydrolase-fold protein [Opitutus sp. ER46]|uniref:alpha/beta hydrolase n=1 Tax=Opitutus sp. ER46 TaxID=2161864 RepID=UPI001E44D767|nr:alpha/beta hydrolase-fold protein [Opitutus sp. ER46]